MARNPTTTSQVHAHQFVIRRMESALVRKDPVLLHEPMRNHLRAAGVGLVLGVLGCAGFFVFGLFSPDANLRASEIVVGKESGAIYVVQQQDPFRLIPVRNLASARLLFTALSGPGAAGAAQVSMVDDSTLADAPRGPLTGIDGAPTYLPGPDRRVEPEWAVCDTADVNQALPDAESQPDISMTALAGVPRPGRQLTEDEALLVEAGNGEHYLVFDGRRSEVDLDDRAVVNAYRLADAVPRKVSTGLLDAIPEGDALDPPAVPGDGEPSSFSTLQGYDVGSVIRQELADPQYYLILRDGKQRVPEAVANLIRVDDASAGAEFESLPPEDVSEVPDVPTSGRIDFDDFPTRVPRTVEIGDSRVACLTWQITDGEQDTAITVGNELSLDEGMRPVEVPPGDGSGDNLDSAYLPPAQGALVRGVVPGQPLDTGSIFLVTDQGLKYGLPSMDVAVSLGLADQQNPATDPAPESILRLLPSGPSLQPQDALELFDPDLAAQRQQQQLAGG